MSDTLVLPDVSHAAPEVQAGPVEVGSDAHKVLFCRALLDTFDPYRPAVQTWPALDEAARARLVNLPIWDLAVQTEELAAARVRAFSDGLADPLLRKAVELDAFEELRHKHVLTTLAAAYGITLAPPRPAPAGDAEFGFLRTGYGECLDTFFAFGLFETARRSGFFPPALVEAFEPVIKEEARHILFFVNWVAWHRANLPWWRRAWFALEVAVVWACLLWSRVGLAGGVKGKVQDGNFTMTGAQAVGTDVDLEGFLRLCLAEDRRRLGAHDPRLLRPTFVPALARLVCAVLALVGRRAPATV